MKFAYIAGIMSVLLVFRSVEGRRHDNNKEYSSNHRKSSHEISERVLGMTYYELPNQYLYKREIGNVTLEKDADEPELLSPEEILMQEKLMAYTQKLLLKEAKKQAKAAKKAAKAKAKAEFIGITPDFWAPPAPATIAPGILAPLNETAPIPPGYWLNKKAIFLSKLFTALATAANNLTTSTTTTTTPVPPTTTEDYDENDESSPSSASSEDTSQFGSLIQDYIAQRRSTDIDDGNFYEIIKRVMTSGSTMKSRKSTRSNTGTGVNTGLGAQYKALADYLRQDKETKKMSNSEPLSGYRQNGPRK